MLISSRRAAGRASETAQVSSGAFERRAFSREVKDGRWPGLPICGRTCPASVAVQLQTASHGFGYESGMLQALLSQELHPDVLASVREAYSMAITHVCFHESEFSHLTPRLLGERLAKLVARRASSGERDPIRIRDSALADLRLNAASTATVLRAQ